MDLLDGSADVAMLEAGWIETLAFQGIPPESFKVQSLIEACGLRASLTSLQLGAESSEYYHRWQALPLLTQH